LSASIIMHTTIVTPFSHQLRSASGLFAYRILPVRWIYKNEKSISNDL